MVIDISKSRGAIESLYAHSCDIYGYRGARDGESGITEEREIKLYEKQPCRASFELSYPLSQGENTAEASQRVKLFLAPEVEVPCGSRVEVFVNGERLSFGFSGEQALYDRHKEIRLKPLRKEK